MNDLSQFPEENPYPVMRIDEEGRILYSNQGSKNLLQKWRIHRGDTVPDPWRISINEILRCGEPGEVEEEVAGRHYALTAIPVRDKNYVNLYGRDITAEKKAKAKIELDATVFAHASEAILVTDRKGNIVDVNSAFCNITGYNRSEVLGRNPNMMKSGRHGRRFYEHMWQVLNEKGSWRGEIWDRRKDGTVYPKWLSMSKVQNENGAVTHYIGVFSDISSLKETEERLYYLAHYDDLTGLGNRNLFRERLEQALRQAKRNNSMFAVLLMDLDGFKNINDTFGHTVGDRLLAEISQRLKEPVPGV